MATSGRSRRPLERWIARASSSLPVPGSPEISAIASVPAIMRAFARQSSSDELRVRNSRCQWSVASANPEALSARRTSSSNCSFSTGLVRKAKAPDCVARTASGIVPWAVSRMTLSAGQRRCSSRSSEMPSDPGMRRSVITRSGRDFATASTAAAAFETGSTSYFSARRRIDSRRSNPGSSSTTTMRAARPLRESFTASPLAAWAPVPSR